MKITNKKSVLVFKDMQSLNNAVDFMLHLGKPFNTILKKPVMMVTPKIYKKYCLDLTFEGVINTFTTFNIKTN